MTRYLENKATSESCSKHNYTLEQQVVILPFHGDANHEAYAGRHAEMVDVEEGFEGPGVSVYCHGHNQGAELNEVRNEKVDDVDRSHVVLLDLQIEQSC